MHGHCRNYQIILLKTHITSTLFLLTAIMKGQILLAHRLRWQTRRPGFMPHDLFVRHRPVLVTDDIGKKTPLDALTMPTSRI